MTTIWKTASPRAAAAWDDRLPALGASFQQLPWWNAAMRSWRLRVSALECEVAGEVVAFLSLQSLGWGRARVGIVREGPVWTKPLASFDSDACLRALADRLSDLGFVAVCFAHREAALLARIETLGPATRERLMPFAVNDTETLLVPLAADDDATLAGFSPIARRDIRRATAAGYTIEESAAPRDLARAWPIWKKELRRMNVYHRSRATYARVLCAGGERGGARLFLAILRERVVQAILVVFAGREAAYVLGALDREALGGAPSPSCLLHWHAMRAARERGCGAYDLGSRSGSVHRFKSKFRPLEHPLAPPVCLVLEPALFPLCRWMLGRVR